MPQKLLNISNIVDLELLQCTDLEVIEVKKRIAGDMLVSKYLSWLYQQELVSMTELNPDHPEFGAEYKSLQAKLTIYKDLLTGE